MSSASIYWFIDFFDFHYALLHIHPPPPPPTTTQTFLGVLGLIYATKTQIGLTSPPPIWRHFEFQTFLAGHHLYMSPCLCVCVYPCECPKTCAFLCPPLSVFLCPTCAFLCPTPLYFSVSPLCVSVSPLAVRFLYTTQLSLSLPQAKSLHGEVRWGWPTYHNSVVISEKCLPLPLDRIQTFLKFRLFWWQLSPPDSLLKWHICIRKG